MAVDVIRVPPDREYRRERTARLTREVMVGAAREYVPRWLRAAVTVVAGKTAYLPTEDVSGSSDDLVNKTGFPMLVRSVTPSGGAASQRMKMGSKKSGESVRYFHRPGGMFQPLIGNGQPFNAYRSGSGGAGGANYMYTAQLWKPFRLKVGQSLVVTLVTASGASNFAHCLSGIGAESGEPYELADYQATVSKAVKQHENAYNEDIIIYAVTTWGAVKHSLLVEPSDAPSWMRSDRSMLDIGDFFTNGRIVFDFLRGGALILEPNESLVFELFDGAGTGWNFYVIVEAYVDREGAR